MRTENEQIERLTESKPRCEFELFVEEYFGFSPLIEPDAKIETDYGQLVNLLAMFKDRLKEKTIH